MQKRSHGCKHDGPRKNINCSCRIHPKILEETVKNPSSSPIIRNSTSPLIDNSMLCRALPLHPVLLQGTERVIIYFKSKAENAGIPYQTLINLYLKDCVANNRNLEISWK